MENPSKTIHIDSGTIVRIIVIGLLFYFLFILKNLLMVLLLAIVIASSVEPVAAWSRRRGVPRVLSVILIYLSFATIFVGTVYFILLPLLAESAEVLQTLPAYLSSESAQTADFLSNQPFVS